MFAKVWRYRQFIYSSVKREFQSKYTGSLLGSLWAVFQPLSMILVYAIVFSKLMRGRMEGMESLPYAYSVYLCCGVLAWNLFAETLDRMVNVFLVNRNLLKKVAFPRLCLPIISVSSSLLNFSIGFGLFLLFLLFVGQLSFPVCLWFLVLIPIQSFFTVALGIGLGVLNVFFRDVGQFIHAIMQFWFWFTPIVYPETVIPERLQPLLQINPMYHIITGYQQIFVYGKSPSLLGLSAVLLLSAVLAVFSLHFYRQHVGELVDEL